MRWLWLLVPVALSVGIVCAQQPPALPCQAELGQALQRSFTLQALAVQEREALARYFQGELQKLTAERDELQRQLETRAAPTRE